MRRMDFVWIAFGLLVSGSYGAAKFLSWDPGSLSVPRDRTPGVGSHGGGGFTYWSTGFGGK